MDRTPTRPPDDPPDDRLDGPDDSLLTARAAEGDEEAFAVLVRRHAGGLIRLAHRLLGNRAEAEDAVQDAFISAWRKLPEFRGQAGFGTWLYRIVTNRCLNVLRARKPQGPWEAADDMPAPEHTVAPDRITEARAAVRDLHEALTGLSAEQRACWVLREVDGQPYEFIADTLGITQQAVRARVFRARRHLTNALGAWR
ncbi:sigma-70 family RNA polymerase sigma factor [Streptomyces sp. K1PA1]|uniref:Sigma-70 family RNA polymerase sigma factor n=1 Tax=Streptomyces tropicalis TaxID=3034234 RepID=A0ABT6A3M6_9ACTN|nr:sigma-70 family RNA polymerase sigma factor [Streptomyces tropicalis]MDF3299237.1 sigma-70 family RNA polymerase sigma factor [Streptomyces tropicalis]